MKKYIQATLLVVLTILLAGCNAAEEGFNAPAGSSPEFISGSINVTFAGGGEILYLVSLRVNVPIGTDVEGANEIQGIISCAFCNLYVFKEGVETYLPQTSLIDPVAAGSFAFVTDTQGLYRFVIGVLSPLNLGFVNDEGDLVAYSDAVVADIGVSQASLTIEAGPAE